MTATITQVDLYFFGLGRYADEHQNGLKPDQHSVPTPLNQSGPTSASVAKDLLRIPGTRILKPALTSKHTWNQNPESRIHFQVGCKQVF